MVVAERVEFQPWFYWADGVAYIEHGHQYDAFCAQTHPMLPLSPLDPRRIARGFSEVLLRFVVRPTRGLREHGHENFADHLVLACYYASQLRSRADQLAIKLPLFLQQYAAMFRLRQRVTRCRTRCCRRHQNG